MKSIPFFLLFLIFILCISGAVYGDRTAEPVSGKELPDSAREIFSHLQFETKDAFGFRPGYLLIKKEAGDSNELPVSFDLRNVDTDGDGNPDTSYVTPVKLQFPFGTCWGFAAIAAAESSLLSSGIAGDLHLGAAADPEKGVEVLDLSEKHLAYFVNRPILEEDDPQYGEGFHYPDIEEGSSDIYETGGTSFYATSVFASGIGPVLESENELFEYHGRNKIVEQEHKYEQDVDDPFFYYSPDDDWTIDDDLRWSQSFVLREGNILPSPGLYINLPEDDTDTPEGETGTRKETADTSAEWEAANNAIKEELLNGRAVQISFYADHSNPNDQDPPQYINLENWAHYTFDRHDSNHTSIIVGWDDRYPKENFAHEAEIDGEIIITPNPKHDGAWLVKNSWGSRENDFPNRSRIDEWGLLNGQDKWPYTAEPGAKMTGYFWISYEDTSIQMPETFTFDHDLAAGKFWVGQHDFMPVSNVQGTWDIYDNIYKMANIFTAEEDSRLESVSCQTLFAGTKVLYEVYRLNDPSDGPEQGELIAQISAEYPWGGFHREKPDGSPVFRKGDHFAVVVTQQTSDGLYPVNLQYDINEKYASEYSSKYYGNAIVNPGESWLYLEDNSWYDLSEIMEELLMSVFGEWGHYVALDNFPIKAWLEMLEPEYTAPRAKQPVFTGDPLPLVEPGIMISEGTIYYALGTADGYPDREMFRTSVPTAVKPGTYYVWYFVDGDNVRRSTEPQRIVVTIKGSGHSGVPGFFRLEGELPATGIANGNLPAQKPASLDYSPLDMELQIPSLGLISEIVTVTPENGQYPIEWLGEQTGWLAGSDRPGEGLSVLAAHNTLNAEEYGPFAQIGTMREGDRFSLLEKDGSMMMFEVYANEKIGADDHNAMEEIASAFENTLTLLTCEDERPEGGYASRRVVAARKLD